MTDQRQRNILNQMLDFTKSREHCVLALQVLEELVNQINPSSRCSLLFSFPERSKVNETKTAIQFRDSNLMNIIGLAFNMLTDTYQADDATVGTPELRMKLFQYSLQLLLRCLSFDCRMSGSEMTSDNLPVMLLPESWITNILTDDHMSLLFNMYRSRSPLTRSYRRCASPITTLVVEVLLWMWSSPYMDSYSYSSGGSTCEIAFNGILSILSDSYGLNDTDTVHVFCQLLDRIMVRLSQTPHENISCIRRYVDPFVPQIVQLGLPFTQTILSQYMTYPNTLLYLLKFWVHIIYIQNRLGSSLFPEVAGKSLKVVELYVQSHVNSADVFVEDRSDDPLNAMEGWTEELACVGKLVRVTMDEGVKLLTTMWDNLYKDYSVCLLVSCYLERLPHGHHDASLRQLRQPAALPYHAQGV